MAGRTGNRSIGRFSAPTGHTCPRTERLPRQAAVIIAFFTRDLGAEPRRQVEAIVLVLEFDLGDHQAGIFTFEDVDFPALPVPGHVVPDLFDDCALAQRKQGLCLRYRDRELELEAL